MNTLRFLLFPGIPVLVLVSTLHDPASGLSSAASALASLILIGGAVALLVYAISRMIRSFIP